MKYVGQGHAQTTNKSRMAFTLLEVILAIAILGGALVVLGNLARIGLERARRARDLALAQMLCESKLAEILAGVEPLEPVSAASFETGEIPEWLYSIELYTLNQEGLLEVRVTVTQDLPPEQDPVSCTLVRWIVDPDIIAQLQTSSTQAGQETESFLFLQNL